VAARYRFHATLLRLTGIIAAAGVAFGFYGLRPATAGPIDECADISPTQSAIGVCLENKLADAEADLAAKSKLARQSVDAIRGRDQRVKAQRAFDRAQRRFFSERDRLCGEGREALNESERSNKIRDCLIRLTRERSAEIASSLSLTAADSSTPPAEAKPSRPPAEPAPRPSNDPVYGVDWKLTRMIRDNQEIPLPPKYRANLRLETDGRVSGYGAVSAFTGRYRLRSPGKIEWAENGFLITHDAQQPDPTQIDYLYVDSLERTSRAGLSKSGLVLRSEDGSISLSFER
jgi:uncharacterized protein YecT (DUF1311 family)